MIAQCKSLDFKLFSHLLTLCKKLSYNLQNLLLQPSTLKVAHMTSTSERDPAHARDELEKLAPEQCRAMYHTPHCKQGLEP